MAKSGIKFANLPEPLVRYRIHKGSVKSVKLRDTLRGTIEIKQLHFGADMNFRARLRLVGERLLLLLPPKFVLWLFLKTSVKP
jgi:hypothetical protein